MEAHNVYFETVANTAVVNANETIVATLPANVTVGAGVLIVIEGALTILTGATTTALVARVRRGNVIGGALLSAAITQASGAAVTNTVPFQVSDSPGDVAGQQYVLTVQQTGGTSNGTMQYASLQATWIS